MHLVSSAQTEFVRFHQKVLLSRHIFQEWLHPDWREGFNASVLSYTHLVVSINFTCCSYNVSGYYQPVLCISVEPSAKGIEVSSFSFLLTGFRYTITQGYRIYTEDAQSLTSVTFPTTHVFV